MAALEEECRKNNMLCHVADRVFPWRVVICPDPQMSLLETEDTTEIKCMRIAVGTGIVVDNEMEFRIDGSVLKRLIGKTQKAGMAYYVCRAAEEAKA